MRKLYFCAALLFLTACFPTRTAPRIKTYKLQKASKFSKGLPKDTGFIFKDTKEEGAFYAFIQEKFNLDDEEMEHSIAFDLNGKTFLFNFYERERVQETFLLAPMLALALAGVEPDEETFIVSGREKWYVVLLVLDENMKDALHKDHPDREQLLAFFDLLRLEYYDQHHPIEAVFRQE